MAKCYHLGMGNIVDEKLKRANGRLTEAGVRKVRTLRDAGQTYQQIAHVLGVSLTTVASILQGRSHVQ